jgi:hypothetical protein
MAFERAGHKALKELQTEIRDLRDLQLLDVVVISSRDTRVKKMTTEYDSQILDSTLSPLASSKSSTNYLSLAANLISAFGPTSKTATTLFKNVAPSSPPCCH